MIYYGSGSYVGKVLVPVPDPFRFWTQTYLAFSTKSCLLSARNSIVSQKVGLLFQIFNFCITFYVGSGFKSGSRTEAGSGTGNKLRFWFRYGTKFRFLLFRLRLRVPQDWTVILVPYSVLWWIKVAGGVPGSRWLWRGILPMSPTAGVPPSGTVNQQAFTLHSPPPLPKENVFLLFRYQ